MAITPSQWGHVLTIPEAFTPSAATSGQTLVITEGVIAKLPSSDQDTFWNAVQNGGGDVRICENEDGTNQLPVEVANLDNVARTCVIWTRKPSYNGGDSIYLFVGKAGETQPPVTDPFGRNAVWTDYNLVIHQGTTEDSTGRHTPSLNGSPSLTTEFFGGDAYQITGNSDAIVVPPDVTLNQESQMYIQVWLNDSGRGSTSGGIAQKSAANNDGYRVFNNIGGRKRLRYPDLGNFDASNPVAVKRLGFYWDGSTQVMTDNGALTATRSASGAISNNNDSLVIGNENALNTPINSILGDFWLSESLTYSPEREETEYANQSDNATFFGTPTLAVTGDAGITLIPTLIPSGEVVGTPSVTNLLKLIEPNTVPTGELVKTPTVDAGAILISPATIPTGEVVYNVSVVDLTQFVEAESIPTQEVVGSPNLELLLSRILPTDIVTQENFETPVLIGGDRIAIPINDRATWNRVATYLRTRQFKGSDNDVILAWLRSEGYIDTFNDAFNTYLEDVEALQGSLTDKYSNWRRQ